MERKESGGSKNKDKNKMQEGTVWKDILHPGNMVIPTCLLSGWRMQYNRQIKLSSLIGNTIQRALHCVLKDPIRIKPTHIHAKDDAKHSCLRMAKC